MCPHCKNPGKKVVKDVLVCAACGAPVIKADWEQASAQRKAMREMREKLANPPPVVNRTL